jgi:DNA polymerase-3 subunit epsilon
MLDFETTGLSPVMGDRITEVAALRIVNGEITERYVSLVNCGVRIPYFITQLTGISQDMVDSAPPVHRVLPELLDFIGGDALSAHNASFDEKFLKAEAELQGRTSGHTGLVCSLGIRFRSAAHRAESDAEVAAEVMIHIARHLDSTYGVGPVRPDLLVSVNKLSAAKVPDFLHKYAASNKTPQLP